MNFENVSTDELFTELMKRVEQMSSRTMFFIDNTTVDPYPTWNIHTIDENRDYHIIAREVV